MPNKLCDFAHGFFFQDIAKVNQLLTGIDENANIENDTEAENTEVSPIPPQDNKWGWIEWVDNVAETTGRDWDTVYNLNIIEFINTMSYIKYKSNKIKRTWNLKKH